MTPNTPSQRCRGPFSWNTDKPETNRSRWLVLNPATAALAARPLRAWLQERAHGNEVNTQRRLEGPNASANGLVPIQSKRRLPVPEPIATTCCLSHRKRSVVLRCLSGSAHMDRCAVRWYTASGMPPSANIPGSHCELWFHDTTSSCDPDIVAGDSPGPFDNRPHKLDEYFMASRRTVTVCGTYDCIGDVFAGGSQKTDLDIGFKDAPRSGDR